MNIFKKLFFVLLIAFFAVSAHGQTYRVLYSCDAPDAAMKSPGSLVLSGSALYGIGSLNSVFKIDKTGDNFSVLHTFDTDSPYRGVQPSSLLVNGSTLYGTLFADGVYGGGSAFKMGTNGSGFDVMHSFGYVGQPNDGFYPWGETLAGSTLYGATYSSGPGSFTGGTVYKINTDNTGYSVLHRFTTGVNGWDSQFTTSGPILSGSTLYGSAYNTHEIYRMNTNGSGFGAVYTFTDGTWPGRLALSGSRIYGITNSTLFAVNTNGSNFEILHSFGSDEGSPDCSGSAMILAGSTIYGTTTAGGSDNCGVIYQMGTDGRNFKVLHSFTAADGRYYGKSELILDGNTLYGITPGDSINTFGSIYALTIPEPSSLTILGIGAIVLAGSCYLRRYK